MKADFVYLNHIAECIHRIEKNIDVGLNDFLISETIQDATLRNLQTMSEATQRLSDELNRLTRMLNGSESEASEMSLSTIIWESIWN